MIEFISSWTQQIIIAVVIATIIEMIVPKGNNKKYIKAVIGIYILFTIISPVIQKFTRKDINLDFDSEKYFNNTKEYQTMSDAISTTNNQSIEELYTQNLKSDIKNKLKEKGYEATNIQIEVNLKDEASYGNINKISMKIQEIEKKEEITNEISNSSIEINAINKISIGNNTTNNISTNNSSNTKEKTLEQSKIKEIKQYLSSVYNLNEKYIIIH